MSYSDVLNYWFAGAPLGREQMNRWWKKDSSVDEWIKNQFGGVVDKVFGGEYRVWCETTEGYLAAVICLDQFPRNMYRVHLFKIKQLNRYQQNRHIKLVFESLFSG